MAPSKPPDHVHWPSSLIDHPDSPPGIQIPSAYDAGVHRRRASTPRTPSLKSERTDDSAVVDDEEDVPPRGRSRLRTVSLLPAGQRLLSRKATKKKTVSKTTEQDDLHATPFLTTVEPPTPADFPAKENPAAELLEPPPNDRVSTSVSERLTSSPPSTHSHESVDSRTDSSYFPDMTFHQLSAPSLDDRGRRSSSSSSDLRMNASPFETKPTYIKVKKLSGAFKEHKDTFALLGLKKGSRSKPYDVAKPVIEVATGLPILFLSMLAKRINHQTYLNLRLTSRAWCTGITRVRPLVQPAVFRLPIELIQMVYEHLQPSDFNSARHTCRNWMSASLDRSLLESMLKKGGWWIAAKEDADKHSGSPDQVGRLQCNLARECALSSAWTGNGVQKRGSRSTTSKQRPDLYHEPQYLPNQLDGSPESRTRTQTGETPFALVLHCDASELGDRRYTSNTKDFEETVHFTASVCGRFVTVVDGWRIYVYHLERSGTLVPATVITCPQRVLAVSMDTSCGRYAVAALLEGRTGLLCDLVPSSADELSLLSCCGTGEHFHSIMHKGNGARTLYHGLCLEEDPPLSVAICPSRRCVAFGCKAGIELHWMDAISQQDLSRWFPLTAPSDFLYFLPPKPGSSNTRKLRLVSSKGIGTMKGRLRRSFKRFEQSQHSQSHSLLNFLQAEPPLGRWVAISEHHGDCHDNYKAVPLSDGKHVLFTDPCSYRLCLGTNTPENRHARMERRVLLIGPPGRLPEVYAAGSDLTAGIRIVASFGSEVWFFSVPRDIFECHTSGRNEPWAKTYAQPACQRSKVAGDSNDTDEPRPSTLATLHRIASSRQSHNDSDPLPTRLRDYKPSVWPVTLYGQRIASIPNLVDLAIDSRPASMTIWSFSSDGIVRSWQIKATQSHVAHFEVQRCGAITPLKESLPVCSQGDSQQDQPESASEQTSLDADGDVIIGEAPPLYGDPALSDSQHSSIVLNSQSLHRNSSLTVSSSQQNSPTLSAPQGLQYYGYHEPGFDGAGFGSEYRLGRGHWCIARENRGQEPDEEGEEMRPRPTDRGYSLRPPNPSTCEVSDSNGGRCLGYLVQRVSKVRDDVVHEAALRADNGDEAREAGDDVGNDDEDDGDEDNDDSESGQSYVEEAACSGTAEHGGGLRGNEDLDEHEDAAELEDSNEQYESAAERESTTDESESAVAGHDPKLDNEKNAEVQHNESSGDYREEEYYGQDNELNDADRHIWLTVPADGHKNLARADVAVTHGSRADGASDGDEAGDLTEQ